jgi:hypothetical protein
MTEALTQAFRIQGHACRGLGSPFYADLCEAIAGSVEGGDELEGVLAPWAGADVRALFGDAVVLRLLGALHDRVLSGEDPALAAAYPHPGQEVEVAEAWRPGRAAIAAAPARIAAFMDHEPQTNEVRRSVCLVGGFLTVAKLTGLPIRAFELGASAGLNTSWDHFRYRLGDATWGDPAAKVVLDADWTGPAPPVDAEVRVAERAACDRRPVDLTDPIQRRRLLAYLWPDQFERAVRIRAAIDLALELGVKVETADAPTWAAQRAAPKAGAATVLYHSVFWQYMPAESQAALTATIEGFGAQATAEAPFAWLRMEPPPENMAGMEVRLTLWPGGQERVLAQVHPHGATVKWLGSDGNIEP